MLACLVLGLLLAACGGSGSTSDGTESTSASDTTTESASPSTEGTTEAESAGPGEDTNSGGSDESTGKGAEEAEGESAEGSPESTDGSDKGERATGSSGKAKVVEQGEAICKKAREEQVNGLSRLAKERKEGTSKAAFIEEVIRGATLPPIQAAAEQLATVGAPEEIVTGLEEAVAKTEANPFSLSGASNNNPFDGIDRKAAQYGLKSCAQLA